MKGAIDIQINPVNYHLSKKELDAITVKLRQKYKQMNFHANLNIEPTLYVKHASITTGNKSDFQDLDEELIGKIVTITYEALTVNSYNKHALTSLERGLNKVALAIAKSTKPLPKYLHPTPSDTLAHGWDEPDRYKIRVERTERVLKEIALRVKIVAAKMDDMKHLSHLNEVAHEMAKFEAAIRQTEQALANEFNNMQKAFSDISKVSRRTTRNKTTMSEWISMNE